MKTIGGFPALELPAGPGRFHHGATALASGRACWHRILQEVRPSRVLVPFYLCDSALEPLRTTHIPYEFYPMNERCQPDLDQPPRDGELLLAVNYFGLLSGAMETLSAAYPGRVVIDDSQAFFRRGNATAWSFNSARKFFGVPDGGYLYGPIAVTGDYPPSTTGDCEHLVSRLEGDNQKALQQYRAHEARMCAEVRAMSAASERLLAAIDYDAVCRARRTNVQAVHRRLGAMNRMPITLDARDVPLCYPFLPESPIALEPLWAEGLFIARFWPEIESRSPQGFARERDLARALLPLPVDQRYNAADMDELCDRLLPHLR